MLTPSDQPPSFPKPHTLGSLEPPLSAFLLITIRPPHTLHPLSCGPPPPSHPPPTHPPTHPPPLALRTYTSHRHTRAGDGALLGFTLAQTSAGNSTPLVKPDGTPTNEVHTFMPDLAPLAGDGMVAKTFEDPGAVLAAANERIAQTLGL